MKIFTILIIVSSLFTLPSQNLRTLSQTFLVEPFTTSLITQLDGPVEIVYWERNEMLVEMTIQEITLNKNDYILKYEINKNNFEGNL